VSQHSIVGDEYVCVNGDLYLVNIAYFLLVTQMPVYLLFFVRLYISFCP